MFTSYSTFLRWESLALASSAASSKRSCRSRCSLIRSEASAITVSVISMWCQMRPSCRLTSSSSSMRTDCQAANQLRGRIPRSWATLAKPRRAESQRQPVERWFDKKHNRMHQETEWVKGHIACGKVTNIITDVAVTATESADAPFLAPFVETTAKHFDVREVWADKAYISKKNLRAVEAVGGTAYIPFKSNSNPTNGHHKRDALWERAYHFYHLHRAEFEAHYHARFNVETTFHMVKAKFGASAALQEP